MAARLTYVAATFLLGAAGTGVASRAAAAHATGVVAGVAAAWAIQAVSFWKLAGRLDRGRDAVRVWVAGMGARAGGLALAFVAGSVPGVSRNGLLLGYGGAILAFLLLEVAWLAARRPAAGAGDDRPAGGTGRGDRSST